VFKKPLIAAAIVALICVGLWAALSQRSFDMVDNLINSDGGGDSRVLVNVYERRDAELLFADALEPDAEKAVKRWFTEYNAALGELGDVKSFSKLYEDNSPSVKTDVSALSHLIEARGKCTLPLTFSVCDTGLKLVSAVYGDSSLVEVRVEECFAAVFDGFPDRLSTYAGREHFFTLEKFGDKWLIRLHENSSPYKGATGQADYAAGAQKYAEFPYERGKAADYAAEYTDREEVLRNRDYAEYADNGMNFVSQCLYAGGIPTDSEWNKGTAAFYDGDAFYKYVSSGGAAFAAGICDYKDAEKGDIMQFTDLNGAVLQSALILENYGGELLLAANGDDMYNFPAAATGFDSARVIKIYGYN